MKMPGESSIGFMVGASPRGRGLSPVGRRRPHAGFPQDRFGVVSSFFTATVPRASNLPAMAFIDLHLHLLPGVDDGSPDEATALEHAARMVAAGVTEATVTPHVGAPMFPLDPLTIPDRTRALQAAVDREGIGLTLHPGGEIHPDVAADLDRRALDAIAHGPPGARWVLAE